MANRSPRSGEGASKVEKRSKSAGTANDNSVVQKWLDELTPSSVHEGQISSCQEVNGVRTGMRGDGKSQDNILDF